MTYRWLWSCLIAGSLLLMGCTDRSEDDLQQPEQGVPLQLGAVTRTEGAASYTGSQNIHIYLTNADGMVNADGEFSASGWTSNLNVKEESQYYIYGYMPSSITAIQSAPDGGYSNGINLTFNDLPAITKDDICIVVGVDREKTATTSATVTVGNYSYLSGINTQNYVNLLMDHLFTGLEVRFKLDEDYAKLRSIYLTECTLQYTYKNVDATVNIRKGKGIVDPSIVPTGSSSDKTFSLLASTDPVVVLDKTTTSTPVSLKQAYCAPCLYTDNTKITITSKYDVYDKSNHKIGNTRTSVNTLNTTWPESNPAAPGMKKTVTLTVKPTYLYILSDNDLDNPVISLSSE